VFLFLDAASGPTLADPNFSISRPNGVPHQHLIDLDDRVATHALGHEAY
jgi:hypothetical protein